MRMPPEYLLLPANRAFIAASIAGALVLNLLPWGRSLGMPDFLAVVLVFWNIHQPRKVGIGVAFLVGLLMDVHASALLGERALAYSLLSYGAIAIHRRVVWFGPGGQMLHVLPLFLLAQCVVVAVRSAQDPEPLIAMGRWPGQILREYRGTGGFGYDPLMFIPGLNASVAELSAELKNTHSHRAMACRELLVQMRQTWGLADQPV